MYPILIACIPKPICDTTAYHLYPDEVKRPGFTHVPLVSYCRTQALEAIRATGGLWDVDAVAMRWRASVPDSIVNAYDTRLEIFTDNEDNTLRLVYSAPLCGPEFKKLPLVLRLGLELLYRKECRGKDTE